MSAPHLPWQRTRYPTRGALSSCNPQRWPTSAARHESGQSLGATALAALRPRCAGHRSPTCESSTALMIPHSVAKRLRRQSPPAAFPLAESCAGRDTASKAPRRRMPVERKRASRTPEHANMSGKPLSLSPCPFPRCPKATRCTFDSQQGTATPSAIAQVRRGEIAPSHRRTTVSLLANPQDSAVVAQSIWPPRVECASSLTSDAHC